MRDLSALPVKGRRLALWRTLAWDSGHVSVGLCMSQFCCSFHPCYVIKKASLSFWDYHRGGMLRIVRWWDVNGEGIIDTVDKQWEEPNVGLFASFRCMYSFLVSLFVVSCLLLFDLFFYPFLKGKARQNFFMIPPQNFSNYLLIFFFPAGSRKGPVP